MIKGGITYRELKKKYGDFAYPKVFLSVGGKLLKDNRAKLVLTDVTVDVSVGYEASILTFSLYQVYDEASGSYRLKDFKDYVMLGSKAEISMGYGEKLEKLFVGFISQVRFVKEQETIHHVEVTAMDIKGIMMANGCARQLLAGNFGDGVKEIFDKSLYQKLKAEGIFAGAKIMDTPDKKDACTLEMVWESDYEFVVKAAKYFNYEFFVERGTVYFRRAKETGEASLLELSCEEGLSFYDISYDITGLVKKVEVRGMDASKGQVISAVKQVSNKISLGTRAKSLIGKTEKVVMDAGVYSKEQAQYRADSLMEEMSYRFGNLECECVGLPELMPGHFVDIAGLSQGCDNRFYITNATHVINDTEGYKTFLTGKAASLK